MAYTYKEQTIYFHELKRKKKRDFADGVTISEFQYFCLTENAVSFTADSNTRGRQLLHINLAIKIRYS